VTIAQAVNSRKWLNKIIKVVLNYYNIIIKAGGLYLYINEIDLNPFINITEFDRLKRGANIIKSIHLIALIIIYKLFNFFAINSIDFKTNSFVNLFIARVFEALISLLNNIIDAVI
jgi:predicted SprT family Zn-dependent metalloprotease